MTLVDVGCGMLVGSKHKVRRDDTHTSFRLGKVKWGSKLFSGAPEPGLAVATNLVSFPRPARCVYKSEYKRQHNKQVHKQHGRASVPARSSALPSTHISVKSSHVQVRAPDWMDARDQQSRRSRTVRADHQIHQHAAPADFGVRVEHWTQKTRCV